MHDTLLRSHKSKASGDQISSRGTQLIHERRRADGKREFEFQQLREQSALRREQEAKRKVVDMEFHTTTMIERAKK